MVDLASIWESINDACWPIVDAIHLGQLFEDHNIPPVIFPLAIVALIILLLLMMSGGGAPPIVADSCGDGMCTQAERSAGNCTEDCDESPDVTGKTVIVRFTQIPPCQVKITLQGSDNGILGAPQEAKKIEFTYPRIDADSVKVFIEDSNQQSYTTALTTIDEDSNIIQIPTFPSNLCKSSPTPVKGTLRLSIKDSVTQSPINSVRVSIREMLNGQSQGTSFDGLINGNRDIPLTASKTYTIYAEKEEYSPGEKSVTISSVQATSETVLLTPLGTTPGQTGELEVCVSDGTNPLTTGTVRVEGTADTEFILIGDLADADPADEPRGPGCFVFKDIPAGKILTASVLSPPTGCVPAATQTVTITAITRQYIPITLDCPADGSIGYLKLKIVTVDNDILTQNATITLWKSDGTLISGTGTAGALQYGTGGFTEEVTVPANTSLYVWVRELPLGYLDYKSDFLTVAKGQHKPAVITLNYSQQTSPQVPPTRTEFVFSGVSAPRILSTGQSFNVAISSISYGQTQLASSDTQVSVSIGGVDCPVAYESSWIATCTASDEPGSYGINITATYSQETGRYSTTAEVREYASGDGIISVIPMFSTYGEPPLDLYFNITFNGLSVSSLSNQRMSLAFTDSPGAYAGVVTQLTYEPDGFWTLTADVPYKGDYQLEMYLEVLNGSVYYNTTYLIGFVTTAHSEKLKANIYLQDSLFETGEVMVFEAGLQHDQKVARNLQILKLYSDGVYYTVPWQSTQQQYYLSMQLPNTENCNLQMKLLINGLPIPNLFINGESVSKDAAVHVIDLSATMAPLCPLDSKRSCDSVEEMRQCVSQYLGGTVPYTEQQIFGCIQSGCSSLIPPECPSLDKGDLVPDCVLDEEDVSTAESYVSTVTSPSDRNKFAGCMDMDNDGDVDNNDLTCLKNVVSTKWYGDVGDNTCNAALYGGFCFDIDVDSPLPGDMANDGMITKDDEDIMVGILEAVFAGVTVTEDILYIADINRDGSMTNVDLECLRALQYIDFETGTSLGTGMISQECLRAFDLSCRGTKGDLDSTGTVTEKDLVILNLLVSERISSEGLMACADMNEDGSLTEDDLECIEAYLSGNMQQWKICIDCDENMPPEAYGDEICNDGFDNNCDGLKDVEDNGCLCNSETPCTMKKDSDGGVSPGVNDGKYALCRDVSWDMIGYLWFTPAELECTKDRQCKTMEPCLVKGSNCVSLCKCSKPGWGDEKKWYETGELPGERCGDGWDNDCVGGDMACDDGGSCPFVYSYNGMSYIFDHEAYSFSVSSLMEDTSYETLESLKPVDGKLKLKLSEELDETSYTNYVKLLSVSHPAGTQVMPDQTGQLHTIRSTVAPESCASDFNGDCLSLVSKADGMGWVADLTKINVSELESVYNEAVLEFPASESAEVKLVYRAKESGLISFMDNELYKIIGGNNIEELISLSQATQVGTAYDLETSLIHFSVWDGFDWVEQEARYVGGARWSWSIAPISVTPGAPIKIKVTELVGSFPLDFVGIDYSADEEITTTELLPVSADQSGKDVLSSILSDDDQYLEETTGDVAYIEFVEPSSITPGSEQSYVVVIGGYYLPNLPEKPLTIDNLLLVANLASDDRSLLEYVLPVYLSCSY